MLKTLDSMKWMIGFLFVLFFIGMIWFVRTGFSVWEPPPQGYSDKELLHNTNAQLLSSGKIEKWVLESPLFTKSAISVGENQISFRLASLENIPIKTARLVITIERPATLSKAQRLEFVADPSGLPAQEVTIQGKILVPDLGRWEIAAFAIINEAAGVRWVKVLDSY